MKTRIASVVLLSLIPAVCLMAAQRKSEPAPAAKKAPARSPADQAYDEYNKVYRDASGKMDQARFQKVIAAGISYLSQYPTHGSATGAIRDLPRWAEYRMKDKAQTPQRIAYLSLLKYELLTAKYKEGLSNDAKAAMAALDASTAYAEAREAATKQNLDAIREKIDALSAMPGASRYLVDRERAYLEIFDYLFGAARTEEHLQNLAKHSDKGVASFARQQLNIVNIKKTPYELNFTGLDGKPVNFAQLRGKVVAMYFWTTGTRDNQKNIEYMKDMHSRYRKKGFEVVTVSLDKAEDRPKLEKYIKDNRISFPVHFDGQGTKTDFVARLGTAAGRMAIFDKAGILQSNDLQMGQLENAIKVLQEPPKKK